ncbi:MAG TPA: UvrD-helicase domain-containing protein [Flavobacteriales bacterium]
MFEVLHSSAGAGKTHALVKHYLLLCLRGSDRTFSPEAYRQVLALTFTNKAAGEMRERIIDYLEGLSRRGELSIPLQDVCNDLMTACAISAEETARRAQLVMEHMLHHWPQLAVSTIDAFTRRVVMPFARDLRLDHDLQMTTEEDHYRTKAVDLLLEDVGSDAALTALLVETCNQLLEEERAWRPERPLLSLSKQLGREDALEHLRMLRDLSNERYIAIQARLGERTRKFRDRIRTIARTALDTVEAAGIEAGDLASGKTGIHSFLRKMAAFDDRLEMNRNALRSFEQGKWHAAKADPSVKAAIEGIAPVLEQAMREVIDAQEELGLHALAMGIWRDLMPTAALHALDERLERIKTEEGIAFFSDLTRKVADIVQQEPAPFLFERLGERYHHILIDEFQDTSVMQWHALLPLLENALSTTDEQGLTGSALLVGDAKQAIYRFRNGEARQFVLLPHLFAKHKLAEGGTTEQVLLRSNRDRPRLTGNYRSGNAIIHTNNALFATLRGVLDTEDQRVYDRHEQDPKRAMSGLVEIACLDGEAADAALEFTARRVQESVDDGFRPGDIAVLIRTRTQGRAIAQHLVTRGWNVVSPDGLALNADAGVNAALAVLAWLDRNEDVHAARAVQYMGVLDSAGEDAFPFPSTTPPREILRGWLARHPELGTRLPLFTLVHRILSALGIDPGADAFAMGLLQEVHAFSTQHADPPSGFLEHWDRIGGKRSASGAPTADAIRIMTVHASKGLQFPVVIVPWSNMGTRGAHDERIWVDARSADPELPTALVRFREPVRSLPLPEVLMERRQQQLDLLNLLYVAFTRPEQRLYAALEAGGNDPLIAAMRAHFQLQGGQVFTAGERTTTTTAPAPTEAPADLSVPGEQGLRALAIREEAPPEWDPSDPDPYRSRGRAIHAVLARIQVPEDLPRALDAEPLMQGWDPGERDRIAQQLAAILAAPGMDRFFAPSLVALNEATLITAEGKALRPDRIVQDAGRNRVLDIKTGLPEEAHHQQVLTYAALIEQLDGRPTSAHLLYLRENRIVDVLP